MNREEANFLKEEIDSLTVFHSLLWDPVLCELIDFLDEKTVFHYSRFVAKIYELCCGDLSGYIREIVLNSENPYVRAVGRGEAVPDFMKKSVKRELAVLQKISDLSACDLQELIDFNGDLSGFSSGEKDIAKSFYHRTENIHKFGYGIFAKNKMFYVDEEGGIIPVKNPDKTRLSDLIEYESERRIVLDNTRALLDGRPAANILLTGDAGTGKSSTIKAVGNELFQEGLRIIELRKDQLRMIPKILDQLAENPLKFILFIDDLSFMNDDDNFNALKAVLEGSVSAKSENVAIYATSNRRHIIKEKFSDREGDDVHRNDTMQELVSLSERFGIHVTFQKPDKKTFLHIVHHLACQNGILLPEAELDLLAERFALERGNRSARLARQFIDGLLSK